MFLSIKMLLSHTYPVPTWISLTVVGVSGVSLLASVLFSVVGWRES